MQESGIEVHENSIESKQTTLGNTYRDMMMSPSDQANKNDSKHKSRTNAVFVMPVKVKEAENGKDRRVKIMTSRGNPTIAKMKGSEKKPGQW